MDRSVVSPPKSSWLVKFIESFIVVGLVYTAYVLSLMLPKGWKMLPGAFSIGFFVALVFAVCFSIDWQNKESRGAFDSSKRHAVLRGAMRYWLAFHISFYGYAKLMNTQLFHGLSAIIAFAQIGGSILLLFRKTSLLGVCLLLPVLLNITLIDIFYGIFAPLAVAIVFTLELLFLLLLRWKDLVEVFFRIPEVGPGILRTSVKWVIRCLVIILPAINIYGLTKRITHPVIAGKWNVDLMTKNHDTVQTNAWLTDSSAWKSVYIKEQSIGGLGILDDVRWRLAFKLDGKKDDADSAVVYISHYDGKRMQWNTFIGGDSVAIWLSRAE